MMSGLQWLFEESRPTMAHHAPATRARAAVVPDYNENGSGWRTVRPGALEAHDSALAYDADVWAERLLRAHAPGLLKCGGGVTYALSVPRGPHTSTVWWHLGAYQDVSRQDRCWVELKNRGQAVLVKRPGANGSVPLPVRDALDIQRVARQLYDLMKEVARHNGGVDSDDNDRDDGGRRGRGLIGGGGGDGAGTPGVDAVTMAELIAQVRSLTAEVAQLKTAASQAPAAAGVAR